MTHSYVWLDSFVRVPWLIFTCDMTRSHMTHLRGAHAAKWRDLWDMTHSYCDMTDSRAVGWAITTRTRRPCYEAVRSGQRWSLNCRTTAALQRLELPLRETRCLCVLTSLNMGRKWFLNCCMVTDLLVYICVSKYMYTYIYTHFLWIYINTHTYIYKYICIYIHIWIYEYMYEIYIHICI